MIGSRIKKLIKEAGVTQKDLAENLGIPLSTLSGYITGYREPDIGTIQRISAHLGMSVDSLLENSSNPRPECQEIGTRIARLRKRDGLTQIQLAKLLRVGKTTISNYETGYSMPDVQTLLSISVLFDVTTDYLLGRTFHSNPKPGADGIMMLYDALMANGMITDDECADRDNIELLCGIAKMVGKVQIKKKEGGDVW